MYSKSIFRLVSCFCLFCHLLDNFSIKERQSEEINIVSIMISLFMMFSWVCLVDSVRLGTKIAHLQLQLHRCWINVTNWCSKQLQQIVQVLKQQNTPRPSYHHHRVWPLMRWFYLFIYFYEKLHLFYSRCNRRNVQPSLIPQIHFLPKVLELKKMSTRMMTYGFVFSLGSSGSHFGSVCRGFQVVLGSFMNKGVAPSYSDRPATLAKVHWCSVFSICA